MAGKPSPPPIYHLRPIIQPICPMRSPGLWAGPGLRSLRSWIGVGWGWESPIRLSFERALKPIVPLAAGSSSMASGRQCDYRKAEQGGSDDI
jgi:hypothetical protein